jgi:hypothetical protein
MTWGAAWNNVGNVHQLVSPGLPILNTGSKIGKVAHICCYDLELEWIGSLVVLFLPARRLTLHLGGIIPGCYCVGPLLLQGGSEADKAQGSWVGIVE